MTYGSEFGRIGGPLIQTLDSNYVMCGYKFDSSNISRLNLMKINSTGAVVWDREFGSSNTHLFGQYVIQTTDSGFAVVGWSKDSTLGDYDMYFLKTSKIGWVPLYTGTYGGTGQDFGASIVETSDGGYIIVGETSSFGAGGKDIYLVKIDSVGVLQWSKTFGGAQDESGRSIMPTDDGGYIVAGVTNSFGAGGSDMYLIKLNSLGDSVWSKVYGYSEDEGADFVQPTFDGGFVLVGSTTSIGAGLKDMYVVRLGSIGNVIWSRTYGGTDDDVAVSVKELPDGGFIIAGEVLDRSFGFDWDYSAVRTYYTGDTIWTKVYDTSILDFPKSIDLTFDGGYIISGSSRDWAVSPPAAYIVKDGPLEVLSCCLDTTGNVDFDLKDKCNILDLTYMQQTIFYGGPPAPCPEEADLNGDGQSATILDLTFLIDFIFRGGARPSHLCD